MMRESLGVADSQKYLNLLDEKVRSESFEK